MNNDKNKKALELKILLAVISMVAFTLGSALVRLFAGSHTMLLAALMTGAIVSMGLAGAFLINAAWLKNDRNRQHRDWSILDSRMLN